MARAGDPMPTYNLALTSRQLRWLAYVLDGVHEAPGVEVRAQVQLALDGPVARQEFVVDGTCREVPS